MGNRNFFEELTRYRVKIERDGKSIVDVPGVLCLPGLLMAPRLSIAGIIAAPLLGYSMHLENGDGNAVDVENAVLKTAETVVETATNTAKRIKDEIDRAWQEVSADLPETDLPEAAEAEEDAEAEDESDQETESSQEIASEPEKNEAGEIPTIQINPDDSAQA